MEVSKLLYNNSNMPGVCFCPFSNLTRTVAVSISSVMRYSWEIWIKILQISLIRHMKPFGKQVWIETLL